MITQNPNVPSQIVKGLKFPQFMNTLGIIPTSYKDSMTYYECLAWLCKFLEETVIPTVNENGNAVEELQNLFVQLNSYVSNYFENLDVQEEINNKLDEMAEDGKLAEIISQYLNSTAIFGFDNVNSMKNASNLLNGSFAKTLGYYEKNDGGSAIYKIRNITNTDVVDNMLLIPLSNENLVAELIVENNQLDIRQIGATKLNDIRDYVLKIINNNIKCIIPQGKWKTKPLQIAKYNSAIIEGFKIFGNNNENGTILIPFEDQDYIMKIGYDSPTSIANDISISNIEFSTDIYTCINALIFQRVQFSYFDEIGFRKCKCTNSALKIIETWETNFGRFMFRQIDSPYALIFGGKVGSGNISSNLFKFLSFEGCRGTCIKFEENCQYSMSTIDTIDFESGTVAFDDETRVSISTVGDDFEKLAIIETGNGKGEISINNLNLNAIAQYAYVNSLTGNARGYDRVIFANNTDNGFYSFSINNISGVGNVNTPILIIGNTIDKFYCNSNIFQGGLAFDCFLNGCRVFDYLKSQFANNFFNANLDRSYRDLRIEKNKCYCKGTSHAVRVANLKTEGNILYVHAKGNGNINFGGSDHVTLNNVSDYQWFAISMVASSIASYNNLLLGSNSTVEIDDYFFTNE